MISLEPPRAAHDRRHPARRLYDVGLAALAAPASSFGPRRARCRHTACTALRHETGQQPSTTDPLRARVALPASLASAPPMRITRDCPCHTLMPHSNPSQQRPHDTRGTDLASPPPPSSLAPCAAPLAGVCLSVRAQ